MSILSMCAYNIMILTLLYRDLVGGFHLVGGGGVTLDYRKILFPTKNVFKKIVKK